MAKYIFLCPVRGGGGWVYHNLASILVYDFNKTFMVNKKKFCGIPSKYCSNLRTILVWFRYNLGHTYTTGGYIIDRPWQNGLMAFLLKQRNNVIKMWRYEWRWSLTQNFFNHMFWRLTHPEFLLLFPHAPTFGIYFHW